jgi:hypothetical protein
MEGRNIYAGGKREGCSLYTASVGKKYGPPPLGEKQNQEGVREVTIDERLEFLLKSTESLHAQVHELYAVTQEHTKQLQMDAVHIRTIAEPVSGLTRIADAHEQRLSDLEGGEAT